MCFSAPASFASMALLLPCGAAACRSSLPDHRELLPLATMPLLFGLQQGVEGLVWLQQDTPAGGRAAATLFLVFALLLWPVWPSLLVQPLCSSRWRRRLCLAGAGLGSCLGLALLLPLVLDPHWGGGTVVRGSIDYGLRRTVLADGLRPGGLWHGIQLLYGLLALGPFWLAQRPDLRLLGLALVLAAAVTQAFYGHAYTSVWCFLAAALSLAVLRIVRGHVAGLTPAPPPAR
jgi:hypothetical protein